EFKAIALNQELAIVVKHADRTRTRTRTRLLADIEVWNGTVLAGGSYDLADDKSRTSLSTRVARVLKLPETGPDIRKCRAEVKRSVDHALLEAFTGTDQR